MKKSLLLLSFFIGALLYLTRLARVWFAPDDPLSFWLGFIPNFGAAFAMPLFAFFFAGTYSDNELYGRFKKGCILAFILLSINELYDLTASTRQVDILMLTGSRRVFDPLDILASAVGVCGIFLFYKTLAKVRS